MRTFRWIDAGVCRRRRLYRLEQTRHLFSACLRLYRYSGSRNDASHTQVGRCLLPSCRHCTEAWPSRRARAEMRSLFDKHCSSHMSRTVLGSVLRHGSGCCAHAVDPLSHCDVVGIFGSSPAPTPTDDCEVDWKILFCPTHLLMRNKLTLPSSPLSPSPPFTYSERTRHGTVRIATVLH